MSLHRASDEPRAAREGQVVPCPAEHDREPAAEADEKPDEPGRESGQPDAAEVGNGAAAADRGEIAIVAVAEGPAAAAENPVGHIAALLLRDRRDPRQRAAM